MAQKRIPEHLQAWIDARKRHKLSHAHVQMARELGMNPRKLGKLDNHHQEPWKPPLPAFIEELIQALRQGAARRGAVDRGTGADAAAKKAARKEAKQPRLEGHPSKEGNKDAPANHKLDH